jgi:hypothetical protein
MGCLFRALALSILLAACLLIPNLGPVGGGALGVKEFRSDA